MSLMVVNDFTKLSNLSNISNFVRKIIAKIFV